MVKQRPEILLNLIGSFLNDLCNGFGGLRDFGSDFGSDLSSCLSSAFPDDFSDDPGGGLGG